MRVLLDTNAVLGLLRGRADLAASLRVATELVVPVVVLGELIHGYRSGRRFEKNLSVLRRLLAQPFVETRDMTFETAEIYGRLQAELRDAGQPIPTNDVWIAAQSIESGAELWTFDGHFSALHGLSWRRLA